MVDEPNICADPKTWDPPPLPNCNDEEGCRRTVFSEGGIQAVAPTTPGIYRTKWQLVDDGHAWFGPRMAMSYNVVSCAPMLDAELIAQGSDAAPDPTGEADYEICAGDEFDLWIELRNVGRASWTGGPDGKPGQEVSLGVQDGSIDPLVGADRVLISEATNADVRPSSWDPPGDDCNDEAHCQRTVFRLQGQAPDESGVTVSRWRLADKAHGWFGPEVSMTFRSKACSLEPPVPPPNPDEPGNGDSTDVVAWPGGDDFENDERETDESETEDSFTHLELENDGGCSVSAPSAPAKSTPWSWIPLGALALSAVSRRRRRQRSIKGARARPIE